MQQLRVFYRLDNSVIAQIIQVMQLGILTGTDISHYMQDMRLEPSAAGDGGLVLTPEYLEKYESDIETMIEYLRAQAVDEQKA
jgi:hypothetical protein